MITGPETDGVRRGDSERTGSASAAPSGVDRVAEALDLDLGGRGLSELAPTIGEMRNLRYAYLAGNSLTSLPHELMRLTQLVELSIASNDFDEIPREVTELSSLVAFDASQNKIASIPRAVGEMAALRSLRLDENLISDIPPELSNLLRNGLEISLRGNPLREPLPELVSRGADAVATYLDSLWDATAHYEAKVVVVGEGDVGKSSLVAALRSEPFDEARATTHGIEINTISVEHPALDVQIVLRMWDFGGQEVYRITHQFFFSPRCLYLLVWNPRQGHEQNEVEHWLRRIRLRMGADARVLIIATHCDDRQPELDYARLEQTFGEMLVGNLAVDNRTGTGLDQVRAAIAKQASMLPQMGQRLSPRWIDARNAILRRAEDDPQITYGEFLELCRYHDVPDDETATLANLLHDLGHIVYYGDDEGLRDTVVLNPEWLTKAIGYILEDGPTRRALGVLDHTRLKSIWLNERAGLGYPPYYHPYFLRLMEKFDVSYRLADAERRSLVAQLVPYERPDLPWGVGTPVRVGYRRTSVICQVAEPAAGLVAWLTVRHHQSTVGKHWRHGVFLEHPISAYRSEALFEMIDERNLLLEVRAPSPDLFFNVLRDSVERLMLERWPGLSYQLLVPCPTVADGGRRCENLFPLEGLLRFRERGNRIHACLRCGADQDVTELLTGFGRPDSALESQLSRLEEKMDSVSKNVGGLETWAVEVAESMRRVLKAVGTEIDDCPRVFTITYPRTRVTPLADKYLVTLWCEHPGHWHPLPTATYTMRKPHEWVLTIAPYANLILKALRVAVSVGAAAGAIVMQDDLVKRAGEEIELMKALVSALPTSLPTRHGSALEPTREGLTVAEGQGLRTFRVMLFELDKPRRFGGLRRVQDASGAFIWVCGDHYGTYDPGLPVLD